MPLAYVGSCWRRSHTTVCARPAGNRACRATATPQYCEGCRRSACARYLGVVDPRARGATLARCGGRSAIGDPPPEGIESIVRYVGLAYMCECERQTCTLGWPMELSTDSLGGCAVCSPSGGAISIGRCVAEGGGVLGPWEAPSHARAVLTHFGSRGHAGDRNDGSMGKLGCPPGLVGDGRVAGKPAKRAIQGRFRSQFVQVRPGSHRIISHSVILTGTEQTSSNLRVIPTGARPSFANLRPQLDGFGKCRAQSGQRRWRHTHVFGAIVSRPRASGWRMHSFPPCFHVGGNARSWRGPAM